MLLLAFPPVLFVTVFMCIFLPFTAGIFVTFWMGEIFFSEMFPAIARTGSIAASLTWWVYPWMLLAAFIWVVISYFFGGAIILKSARARLVTPEENRELFRLVENTAIMAGLPTPKIYLIDDDAANAFATGRCPKAASIALTRGVVERLDKNELQAVIAHELAHIGNRDTCLMLVVVAGIGCFTFLGETLLTMSGLDKHPEDTGATSFLFAPFSLICVLLAVPCLVFGYMTAPLLRFALSRRREHLADATAVKIIRDPDALIWALWKILENPRVTSLNSCPLVGNMCIASPTCHGGFSRLDDRVFSTHPPIEERVNEITAMMGIKAQAQARATGKAIW